MSSGYAKSAGVLWLVFGLAKVAGPAPIQLSPGISLSAGGARCVGILECAVGVLLLWRKSFRVVTIASFPAPIVAIGLAIVFPELECGCLGGWIRPNQSVRLLILGILLIVQGLAISAVAVTGARRCDAVPMP